MGLSMSHIAALSAWQSKFAAQMKALGNYRKESKEESMRRQRQGRTMSSHPQFRWGWWVFVKVKRREFSTTQAILQDLKRDREARGKDEEA